MGREKVGRGKGRECTGKTPYARGEAEERAWYKTKTYLTRWTAYPCRYCHSWHIGHSPNGAHRSSR